MATGNISIEDRIAELEARLALLERKPVDIQIQRASFTANEGQHCIVEAPPAGMTVTLPRARAQNRNARITFTLRNSNPVRFIAVDSKVNNRSSGVMQLIGTFDAVSDGLTGWGISALATGPLATGPTSITWADTLAAGADSGAHAPNIQDELHLDGAAGSAGQYARSAGSGAAPTWATVAISEVSGVTWAAVLAGGHASGDNNPNIDSGQFLGFGTEASLPSTGQIRAHGAWQLTGDSTITVKSTSWTWMNPADAFYVYTAGSPRLAVNNNGSWGVGPSLTAGSDGQYLRSSGSSTDPGWATIAVGELAAVASDTFLGNISGVSAAPGAVNLSSLAGTDLGFSGHKLNNASTWATVLGRSAHSGGQIPRIDDADYLAIGTSSDKGTLGLSGTTILLASSSLDVALRGSNASLQSLSNLDSFSVNSSGAVLSTDGSLDAKANGGIATRASNGTGGGQLTVREASSRPTSEFEVAAYGHYWVKSDAPCTPHFEGDTGVDYQLAAAGEPEAHIVQADFGNGTRTGFRKSRHRHYWYDEFEGTAGLSTTTTPNFLNTLSRTWLAVSAAGTGTITRTGSSTGHQGLISLTTDTTSGDDVTVYANASAVTDCWFTFSELFEVELIAKISSASSMGFAFGTLRNSNGRGAYFAYDTGGSIADTTVHCRTISSSGTTDTDSNVAPGTGFNVYTIRQTTPGTVEFYIDDVLVATHTTNIPSTEVQTVFFQVYNRAASSRTMTVDYCHFESQDLGARTS